MRYFLNRVAGVLKTGTKQDTPRHHRFPKFHTHLMRVRKVTQPSISVTPLSSCTQTITCLLLLEITPSSNTTLTELAYNPLQAPFKVSSPADARSQSNTPLNIAHHSNALCTLPLHIAIVTTRTSHLQVAQTHSCLPNASLPPVVQP